eukprot:4009032-Pleurochrysis_carterae.AAC.1
MQAEMGSAKQLHRLHLHAQIIATSSAGAMNVEESHGLRCRHVCKEEGGLPSLSLGRPRPRQHVRLRVPACCAVPRRLSERAHMRRP